MQGYGELAALGTAVSWTAAAMLFEGATRRIGVLPVNVYKLVGGTVLLALFSLAAAGSPLPVGLSGEAALLLALSGFLGFSIGDYFLFTAYKLVGSRVSMLVLAASPPLTALAGLLFLGEGATWTDGAGIALTIAGIAAVVAGKKRREDAEDAARGGAGAGVRAGDLKKGVLCAAAAAALQTAGVLTAKAGMAAAPALGAVGATQVRVLAGLAGFLAIALAARKTGGLLSALRDGKGMRATMAGSVFGPFAGVALMLYAVANSASSGAAQAITSLSPVLIIPPCVVFLKQRIGPAEVAGSLVAVGGVAVLMLF